MTTSEWLMIIAILLAPLFALQAQKLIDLFRERRNRKMRVFEALMTTRKEQLSFQHVQALNMIDIYFYGIKILGKNWRSKREKRVLTAWETYLDHLNYPGEIPETHIDTWVSKKDDLFVELLFEISRSVGYTFEKLHLKRSTYSPKAHGEQFLDNESMRRNLVQILDGSKPLPMKIIFDEDAIPMPMKIVSSDETIKEQKKTQEKFDELLNGERTLNVKIVEEK